jgi:hypothetical protein
VSAEWRLAVGLYTSDSEPAPREARLQVALWAARRGYALAEAFAVSPGPGARAAYVLAEELAVRLDAQAVLVLGDVDRERVESLAKRARLMVLSVEAGADRQAVSGEAAAQ